MARELEDEQLEALKTWWERHGAATVGTVVVAVLGFFGYRYWQGSEVATAEAASAAYQQLVAASDAYLAADQTDPELHTTLLGLGDRVKAEHEGTAYAAFAALRLAQLAVHRDALDRAAEELGFALAQSLGQPFDGMVRMRLARVQIAQQQPEAALATLAAMTITRAQRASAEEVRGDAYQALGQLDQARAAYQLALDSLERGTEDRMLAMKLADLPAAPPAPPPAEAAAEATPMPEPSMAEPAEAPTEAAATLFKETPASPGEETAAAPTEPTSESMAEEAAEESGEAAEAQDKDEDDWEPWDAELEEDDK